MEFKNLLPARNRDELRQWLSANYNKESECWVVVKCGRPVDNGTFWYIDAVEEAMWFGWIDSTTKKMDNGITAQRLAPRRKGSIWSELNKERCRRMERLGRMTDAGRAALPDMSEKGFVIDSVILEALQADMEIWDNFQKFPLLYQRVRIDTSVCLLSNPMKCPVFFVHFDHIFSCIFQMRNITTDPAKEKFTLINRKYAF